MFYFRLTTNGSVALMQVYFQENYILAFIAAILHGTFAATIALTLSHDARWV